MQVLKTEVLNELYERTELRINNLHSFRQLLKSTKSFEEFIQHKIKFTQFFFDIEDELREALQSQKSAYVEIKELKDQLDLSRQRYGILETNHADTGNYIKSLKENIKECLEQLKFQDSLTTNNEKCISEFEKKIKNLELENKILKNENSEKKRELAREYGGNPNAAAQDNFNLIMQNSKSKNSENTYVNNIYNFENSERIEKQEASNPLNFEKNQKEKKFEFAKPISGNFENNIIKSENLNYFNKKIIDNDAYSINSIDYNHNAGKTDANSAIDYVGKSKNNEVAEDSLDSSFLYKIKEKLNYSQYNDIISERENSKKLINDFIKDSLSFKYNSNHNNINNNSENLNFSTYQKLHYDYNKEITNEDKKLITFGKNEENNTQVLNNANNYELGKNKNNFYPNYEKSLNVTDQKQKINNTSNFPSNSILNNINERKVGNNNQAEAESYRVRNSLENKNETARNNKINNNEYDKEKPINNFQSKESNEIDINKASLSSNKISKSDKILEIVLKIRTVEDISSIIYHLFGDDILDKIISPNIDQELIEKVDATIQEIERLMQKGI